MNGPQAAAAAESGDPPWTPWMELSRQRAHAKDLYEQLEATRRLVGERDAEIFRLRRTIEELQRQGPS